MYVFADTSCSVQQKFSVGSYLIIYDIDNALILGDHLYSRINFTSPVYPSKIVFDGCDSTLSEMKTIKYILELIHNLYSLDYYKNLFPKIIYTDCLEITRVLKNKKFWVENTIQRDIINLVDFMGINVEWLEGHSKNNFTIKNQIFRVVDKHSKSERKRIEKMRI